MLRIKVPQAFAAKKRYQQRKKYTKEITTSIRYGRCFTSPSKKSESSAVIGLNLTV